MDPTSLPLRLRNSPNREFIDGLSSANFRLPT